jgi:Uma2 family endonuclease
MPLTLALPELVESPPASDPFCYGTRTVQRRQPDGSFAVLRLPLTVWDVLHPQEGDHVVQSLRHQKEVRYLGSVVEARVADNRHALVLSDTAIHWDVPGLSHHCPDVALILNVREVQDQYSSFHVAAEGVRPVLIIEVVSPLTREGREVNTVTKVIEYHAAMVPLYVIVDREREDDWPVIRAYRYAPLAYEPIGLDDRDCLLLADLGLRLCANQNRVTLYDAVTGAEVGDYTAISQALEAEMAARLAAEEQARIDAEARQRAEERARTAEEQARTAAEGQRRAEEQARIEVAARADLERQLRELQARFLSPPNSGTTS